jgi:hypothetical protein
MNELARYRERQWGLAKDYSLFADRVLMNGREFTGRSVSVSILLAQLDPNFFSYRARSKVLKNWFALFAVSIGFVAIIHFGRLLDALPPWVLWLARGLSLLGLVFTILALPLIEYAGFRDRRRPEVPLLVIGRVGPDRHQFESFVARIVEQVAIATNPESAEPILGSPNQNPRST